MSGSTLDEVMENGYGVERSFLCPVHDDHSPSASVNSISGWWTCFSCGAKGKYDLANRYEDPYQLGRALDAMKAKAEVIPKIYSEGWLNAFDSIPSFYWRTRFKDRKLIREQRLGEDPYGTYATIPMRDRNGKVMGVIRRDLTGTDDAKYCYPSGVVVGRHLYNYHRLHGDVLLITEGATDAIAAQEVGFEAAVALYGSRMTPSQAALVHRYAPKRILVATDQDDAGDGAEGSVQRLLGDCYQIQRLLWSDHKDLNSIPVSDRAAMLAEYLPRRVRVKISA